MRWKRSKRKIIYHPQYSSYWNQCVGQYKVKCNVLRSIHAKLLLDLRANCIRFNGMLELNFALIWAKSVSMKLPSFCFFIRSFGYSAHWWFQTSDLGELAHHLWLWYVTAVMYRFRKIDYLLIGPCCGLQSTVYSPRSAGS